jgi:hypothetical protein
MGLPSSPVGQARHNPFQQARLVACGGWHGTTHKGLMPVGQAAHSQGPHSHTSTPPRPRPCIKGHHLRAAQTLILPVPRPLRCFVATLYNTPCY